MAQVYVFRMTLFKLQGSHGVERCEEVILRRASTVVEVGCRDLFHGTIQEFTGDAEDNQEKSWSRHSAGKPSEILARVPLAHKVQNRFVLQNLHSNFPFVYHVYFKDVFDLIFL
jgi:hypothetical protein